MSTFRPRQEKRVCKLNFDDKFFYELPLHENMAREFAAICDKQKKALESIDRNDPTAFDKAYNASLDALDEILGEGAGADVMSIYDEPSLFDIVEVVNYISGEFKAAYEALLGEQKKVGLVPNRVMPGAAPRGRR